MQNEFIFERNKKLAEKTISALKRRFFDAYYVDTKEDALKKAIELINKEDTISWGGATTVIQTGLIDYLINNGYSVINRDNAKSIEEKNEISKKAMFCDTFIMGANAISEDGHLVNIDAIGNRIAALMFGPKNVIVLSSIKKIMPTVEDAVKRARTIAAPVNMQRISKIYDSNTPCTITGSCANCISKDSICANIVITRLCKPQNRVKVILINEDLGF